MTGRSAVPRALAALGLLLFAFVLARSPALHHEARCHTQQPGHCEACRVADPAPAAGVLVSSLPRLDPVASVTPAPRIAGARKPIEREAGRAPPAA